MEIIAPHLDTFRIPAGSTWSLFAADQPQYQALPAICTPDGRVVCQWLPTDEEITRLRCGAPITVILHTFNQPLQPHAVCIGGVDLT